MASHSDSFSRLLCYHLLHLLCLVILVSNSSIQAHEPPSTALTSLEELVTPLSQPDLTFLKQGTKVRQDLTGGQARSYHIRLIAGQYVHVVVEQEGIDVVVALFLPNGKSVLEVDSPNGTQGPEPIWFVAPTTGNYRLEVRSPEPTVKPGHYEVHVRELRMASKGDRNRVLGEQALQEAKALLVSPDEKIWRAALIKSKDALRLCGEPADDRCMADVLDNICTIHFFLHEQPETLTCFEGVLPVHERLDDRQAAAEILSNIGHFYDEMGKPEKALNRFQQALTIATSIRTKESLNLVAAINNNVGSVYARIDNLDQALDKFNEALPIFQQLPNREPEAILRGNIGHIYLEKGRVEDALKQFSIAEPMHPKEKDSVEKAILFNNIGRAHMLLNDPKQALVYYEKALPIFQLWKSGAQVAGTLHNMGKAIAATGNSERAIEYYNKSLAVPDQEPRTVIATLGDLGTLYEDAHQPQDALQQYEKGITFIENLRRSSSAEEVRASQSEALAPFVFKASYLQFTFGNHSRAFDLTELARARTVLDQLGAGHLNLIRSTDPQLIKDRADLESTLNHLERQLETAGPEKLALKMEYAAAQRRYEDWLLQAKLSSPTLSSSRSVKTLSVSEVQHEIDPDTTLLSYFVLPDETLAFVITRDSFHAVELAVKEADLYDQITWFRRFPNTESPSDERLKRLYDSLVRPIKQYLTTHRVCIIPHRELNYLSFAALTDGQDYFGDKHTLFYLSSASALPFIKKNKTMGTRMLVMAQSQAGHLPRLRFADVQAKAVAEIYHTKAVIGKYASKSEFLRQVERYNIVHIVAHAETESASPLFYRIRLGATNRDIGALEVRDIYDLNLANVNLVVLAACETNLGQQNLREDVVTLGRAFTSAGASTVIASLWKVDDEATAILMKTFYVYLKRGMSKADALREAQAEMRNRYPKYAHPYYWSAFVLMGDPGT